MKKKNKKCCRCGSTKDVHKLLNRITKKFNNVCMSCVSAKEKEEKKVELNKNDLLHIVSWSYVAGMIEGHNSKPGTINKKPYNRIKRMVLEAYWNK